MHLNRLSRIGIVTALLFGLSGCGGGLASGDSGMFGRRGGVPSDAKIAGRAATDAQAEALAKARGEDKPTTTIWSLFGDRDNPNTTVEVNKYLWKASLDVLNFLPIESVDPFTGVIVTGYGTPPGGGRSVRATIYVQDPALDARSLKIAMQGRGGAAVSPETIRAVEDAILTRARQLRIQDTKL
ncbi:MAG: hypothetical protein FD162_1049 [Rhodobacteraceae bacterium]|uniref:DUF3576 domain-containing protein n=1 Tax=Cypionkella sp. TaxID=2811411 RepID=UPI00132B79AD|nr:DUF3576 domain-containing protein [Cypionkella sp.]KAF0174611.1 MAG: hypothetical protein FD162_1049 [Paracoccaceae bacterium]MDO8325570.1 DUF3576 domain-containing protein [Cypionkella sp.]